MVLLCLIRQFPIKIIKRFHLKLTSKISTVVWFHAITMFAISESPSLERSHSNSCVQSSRSLDFVGQHPTSKQSSVEQSSRTDGNTSSASDGVTHETESDKKFESSEGKLHQALKDHSETMKGDPFKNI